MNIGIYKEESQEVTDLPNERRLKPKAAIEKAESNCMYIVCIFSLPLPIKRHRDQQSHISLEKRVKEKLKIRVTGSLLKTQSARYSPICIFGQLTFPYSRRIQCIFFKGSRRETFQTKRVQQCPGQLIKINLHEGISLQNFRILGKRKRSNKLGEEE